MKPLKLNLDELAVESFATLPQDEARGTVHAANAPTVYAWEYSCENSCVDSECWPDYRETATSCNPQPSQVYTCLVTCTCTC